MAFPDQDLGTRVAPCYWGCPFFLALAADRSGQFVSTLIMYIYTNIGKHTCAHVSRSFLHFPCHLYTSLYQRAAPLAPALSQPHQGVWSLSSTMCLKAACWLCHQCCLHFNKQTQGGQDAPSPSTSHQRTQYPEDLLPALCSEGAGWFCLMYFPSISSPLNEGWQDSFVSVSIQVQGFPFPMHIDLILFSEHVFLNMLLKVKTLHAQREGPLSKFLLLYPCPQARLETNFPVFWFISNLSFCKGEWICLFSYFLFFIPPQNLYFICSFAICCCH